MCILSFSGMQHLNGIKMFGKQLRVAPSKHQLVQMPKEGQPVSEILPKLYHIN